MGKKIETVTAVVLEDNAVAKTKAEQWLEDAKVFVITSQDHKTKAISLLVDIKAAIKTAEEEKNLTLKPAEATVKAIKNQWKPIESFYAQADELLRSKVNAFDTAIEQKAKEELLKLQSDKRISKPETIAKKENEIRSTLGPTTVYTGTGGGSTRKIPKLKIDDVNKIPDEFWVIDEVALRKAVISDKREIPGASIEFVNSLSII